jgi:hypothetical protein
MRSVVVVAIADKCCEIILKFNNGYLIFNRINAALGFDSVAESGDLDTVK